jgi:RND superfamily putative drug exporter
VIQARARQLAGITDVSVYALNPTTALGLGLAIDYSLFIVACYREEPRAGRGPATLPMYFLHSMGCAGIAPTARRVIPSRRPS